MTYKDYHWQDDHIHAEDREFLMTGYSPEGWKQVFYDEEEEDDYFDA